MNIKVKQHKRTRKNGVSVVRNHVKKSKKAKGTYLPMTGSLEGLHPSERKKTALMRRLSTGAGSPKTGKASKKKKSRNYLREGKKNKNSAASSHPFPQVGGNGSYMSKSKSEPRKPKGKKGFKMKKNC